MRVISLISAMLVVGSLQVMAQNTGYLGRKTMVKVQVVNGLDLPFTGLELERTLSRQLSFTSSFSFSLLGSVEIESDEQVQTTSNLGFLSINTSTAKYTVQQEASPMFLGSVGLKFYPNKIFPAPQGFYFMLEGGLGFSNVDFSVLHKPDSDYRSEVETEHKYQSIYGYIGVPKIGIQNIFKERFVADVRAGFDLYLVDNHPAYEVQVAGSNLLSIQEGGFIVGPSFHLKIGYLF